MADLDETTTAALALIYQREQAATRRHGPPCPRCGHRRLRGDEDLCATCTTEQHETEKAGKRAWARRRAAADATPTQRATTWLKQELRRGPRPSAEVKTRAGADQIAVRTLQRARLSAGVVAWREGVGADHRTMWALPQHAPTRASTAARGTSGRAGPATPEDGADQEERR